MFSFALLRARHRRTAASTLALALATLGSGCSSGDEATTSPPPCAGPLPTGDPQGHAAPLGAGAAGQARAGRISDLAQIAQPAHGRQAIREGDYLLINDRIAVVIEDAGHSDGYNPFGGEILSVDEVDGDGRMAGKSRYVETLVAFGGMLLEPTSVTVLADGSDGGAAIVRAHGRLAVMPFIDGSLSALLRTDFDFEVAQDYVLEPGAEHFTLRVSLVNTTDETVDFSLHDVLGFFQSNHNRLAVPEHGFDVEAAGRMPWLGFVGGPWSFAWLPGSGDIERGLNISGFGLYSGQGFVADACAVTTVDRARIVAGGPELDGLTAAVRRVTGEAAWPAVSGTVRDAEGNPLPAAYVHAVDGDGGYVSRALADDEGGYTLHAPAGSTLQASARGRHHEAVPADGDPVDLAFDAHGTIRVTATEEGTGQALPVRVQVIPVAGYPPTPARFGVLDETNGRLHQAFAMTGETDLVVPPGEHRVIVSRGYEYELFDEVVEVEAGAVVTLSPALRHSVDSTGVMCGDFHIHTHHSADSDDPIVQKVESAVADGLEIICSSEHEWVVDFHPVVEELGLTKWAYGMASSELTTFQWGHFGIIPLRPRPEAVNNGAIDWVYRQPHEVFATAHALPEAPAIIVNHPRGGIGGYFSSTLFDRASATGQNELWSEDFDAIEVFNADDFDTEIDVVHDWFALLNSGRRIAAVGSSDSHHIRTKPVGYPRTCFDLGHDDPQKLTADNVRDALVAGTSTISGGLLMTVSGPGGEGPGDTVAATAGKVTLLVTVEGPSWVAGDVLETYVNGELVDSQPLLPLGDGSSNRYVQEAEVPVPGGATLSWVVFHARGLGDLAPLHPNSRAFAVSNPIYLEP